MRFDSSAVPDELTILDASRRDCRLLDHGYHGYHARFLRQEPQARLLDTTC